MTADRGGEAGGRFFGEMPDPARTRRYFIAAEWQPWDYAPVNKDPVCGTVPTSPQREASFRARKLRYIQYTDDTFTTRSARDPRLGLLGPVLRGVVGDFIVVTFLNRAERPLSMHPHGVRYDKESEGAYYRPRPGLGAAVGSKARFTYVWKLDGSSGPGPGEPSSKAWLYHSHVHDDEEVNLGLIGMIVVTDPARARADGTPADVDREMPALFMMFDETGGLLDPLAARSGTVNLPPGGVAVPTPRSYAEYLELRAQGLRYPINGLAYGNLQGFEMNQGERVRWYLAGLGGQEDFHSVHWHGQGVVDEAGRRKDVVELLPGSTRIADMVVDNPGTWLFQCHVAEHMMEGMYGFYTVHPSGARGADRAPAAAFLGLTRPTDALRVGAAEILPAPRGLRFTGSLLLPRGTLLQGRTLRCQLGSQGITLPLDTQGAGREAGFEFLPHNAAEGARVLGESLEFTLTVHGPPWEGVIPPPPAEPTAVGTSPKVITLPFTLSLDGLQSQTTLLRLDYSLRTR